MSTDHGYRPKPTNRLAAYLAGALARYKLGGSGIRPEWNGNFVTLSFVPPIPGAPEGLVQKRVYYRTLPLNFAATHIAPWRAKGYLKINNEITPKITSWAEPNEYQPCQTKFERRGESVIVQSDYVLC